MSAPESSLTRFVADSPGALAMFDRAMRYLALSERYAHMYRLDRAAVLGRCHYDVFPDLPTRWREVHARCLTGTTEGCDDDEFPRADGSTQWLSWEVRPWHDTDGEVGGLVFYAEDTTARREAELARAATASRYRAVFEHSPIGLAEVDRHTRRYREVNTRLCRMLGRSRDELLALTWVEVSHPDDVAADLSSGIEDADGRVVREKRFVRPDGSIVWGRVAVSKMAPAIDPDRLIVAIEDITTQREVAEQARTLAERERQLRAIVDTVPVPLGLANSRGEILALNAAFTAAFGYTHADLPTLAAWVELGYPDPEARRAIEAQWAADLAAVADHEVPARIHPIPRADGRVHRVQIRARQIGDLVIATFHDVTALVDSSIARAAEAARQELALELAQILTWNADVEARTVTLDARAQAWFGFPAVVPIDDFVGRLIDTEPMTIARAVTDGTVPQVRRVVAAGGRERLLEVSRRVLYRPGRADGADEPVAIAVVARDVTDAQHTLAALRASEERYRVLVDTLDDVVFVADPDDRVTFVNRAIANFGFQPADWLGHRLADLLPGFDTRSRAEYTLVDARGEPRAVRVTVRVKETGRSVGVVVDLTPTRAAEAQLRVAQRMEAVGRLAGGVAHDFNNLLTVIVSYGELARASLAHDDPTCDDLDEILRASERAGALTRQLLAFSRRQVLHAEPVDLDELIGSLAKMLRRLIGEDVELAHVAAPDLKIAIADRGQLEQVIVNLVVNARDAMLHGGRLELRTDVATIGAARGDELELAPGTYVRIAVSDTGTGIDAATRAHIFEPFFTTKEQGKGTGLGLSTVYGIVKQSRGAITLDTEVGRGSTFTVWLPRGDAAAPTTAVRGGAPAARGHETVLIVEDEPALRAAVARVLARAGYRTLVAAVPSEALALAREHGDLVDLVLTDVVMPEMNGRRLAEALAPLCPRARVLYVSGYTDDALVRSGVLGESFLAKPFSPAALTTRVRALLDASPRAGAALPSPDGER